MKLNPEDLVVSTFQTSEQYAVAPDSDTTISPDPTPMTQCYYCPYRTIGGCTQA